MAEPIIKDQLFVTLNANNNYTYSGNLNAPIINKSKCRVLANNNALISTSFLQDSYIMDNNQAGAYKSPGLVYTGDDKSWFNVKDKAIRNPSVTLFSQVTFDNLSINFQFI